MDRGEVAFTRMEKVIFGEDAAAAAKAEAQRLGAENVFLLVSGTLNRETDEIEKLRQALGNIYCGTHDDMPAHSPVKPSSLAPMPCGKRRLTFSFPSAAAPPPTAARQLQSV